MKPSSHKSNGTQFLVGYARVSTEDQILDLQIDALRAAGVAEDNLHVEKVSGASTKRPALDYAIKDLRPGDTLIVWRLDRLARSMRQLYARLDQIYAKGALFKSLTEQFDFGTASGKFVLGILGLVAEFERQITAQRTEAGIKAWKAKGHGRWGPKPKMTEDKIVQAGRLLNNGKSGPQVAKQFKVSTASIYGFWRLDRRTGKWVRKTNKD